MNSTQDPRPQTPAPARLSALQLRSLIRNDEARLEHYQSILDRAAEDTACTDDARGLQTRWQKALVSLSRNRARLAGRELLAECVSAQAPATATLETVSA